MIIVIKGISGSQQLSLFRLPPLKADKMSQNVKRPPMINIFSPTHWIQQKWFIFLSLFSSSVTDITCHPNCLKNNNMNGDVSRSHDLQAICKEFIWGLWWGWLGTGGLLGWLLGEGVPLSRPSVTRAPCLLHHHPGHPGICPLLRRAGEKRNRFSISCKSNKEMGTLLKRAWIEVMWSRGDKPAPAAPGRPGSPGLYLGQPL